MNSKEAIAALEVVAGVAKQVISVRKGKVYEDFGAQIPNHAINALDMTNLRVSDRMLQRAEKYKKATDQMIQELTESAGADQPIPADTEAVTA